MKEALIALLFTTSAFASGLDATMARSLQNPEMAKIISQNEVAYEPGKASYIRFEGLKLGGTPGEQMQGHIVYDLQFVKRSSSSLEAIQRCELTVVESFDYSSGREVSSEVSVRKPLTCQADQ